MGAYDKSSKWLVERYDETMPKFPIIQEMQAERSQKNCILFVLILGGLLVAPLSGLADDKPDDKFFNEKIGPVLAKNCYKCHSAKAEEVQGKLLLDTREGIRKGGNNGPAIVPDNVEKSFLIRAIKYLEDDYQMPPSGKLSDEIIADFVKWVEMGAPDPRDGPK